MLGGQIRALRWALLVLRSQTAILQGIYRLYSESDKCPVKIAVWPRETKANN